MGIYLALMTCLNILVLNKVKQNKKEEKRKKVEERKKKTKERWIRGTKRNRERKSTNVCTEVHEKVETVKCLFFQNLPEFTEKKMCEGLENFTCKISSPLNDTMYWINNKLMVYIYSG